MARQETSASSHKRKSKARDMAGSMLNFGGIREFGVMRKKPARHSIRSLTIFFC